MFEQIELKVPPIFTLADIQKMSDLEIEKFSNDRGYKILTIAAENAQLEVVKYLIKRGDDVNTEINGETAASVAFSKGHYEVVLALLHGNSKIPSNYNHEVASDELKDFINMSNQMHEDVANEFEENLKEKIKKYPTVRHFYNLSNDSLLKTSIINKMFAIYELLLTYNIFLAAHEDMNDILDDLTSKQQKIIRDINLKLSPDLITEEMMILIRNCKLGPDTPDDMYPHCMKLIREAFDFLFKISSVSIILKIVAASRDFKIIFDFNRDSVTFLDPSAEPYTNGLFYYSGRIYIAAKELLDPKTNLNNFGVMIHELCHYAMFLVYNNDANPYYEKALKIKGVFNQVLKCCELYKNNDEIIGSVFDDYPDEMHHAELIVRAPQMLVVYHNETLYENFKPLINFYRNYCVPRMEKELPKIEEKFNPFRRIESKVRRQRIGILILIISVVVCSILGAVGVWYFYNPTISWSSLNNDDKNTVRNAKVLYHGVDVKFSELFANDSNVHDLISSEVIKETLKGDTKSLSNGIKFVYDPFVYLKWENMTEKLQKKFLELDVNFQGEFVPFGSILINNTVLNYLNPQEVRNIFNQKPFNISSETETNVEFYISRYFIDSNTLISENFYTNDTSINFKEHGIKSEENIIENIRESKIFLLSSVAGEGKSTTFRYLSQKLKEYFKSSWVQFVDLKKYYEVYKRARNLNFNDIKVLSDFLSTKLFKFKNLELEIFTKLFESGNVIFLLDGIDEVAPLYENLMLNLTTSIKNLTNNVQLISTRPNHANKFEQKLLINSYKLIPLGRLERSEMLIKFIGNYLELDSEKLWEYSREFFIKSIFNKNVKEKFSDIIFTELQINSNLTVRIFNAIKKCDKIFDSLAKAENKQVTNPLLVQIISSVAIDEDFEIKESLSLYHVYETFETKKFKLVFERGEVVGKDIDKIAISRSINVNLIHQAYAVKLLFGDFIDSRLASKGLNISDLNVMDEIKKLNNEQISRFGIVHVLDDDFNFVHRTFAEFFAAQFLYDSLLEKGLDPNTKDGKIKLFMITYINFFNFENLVKIFFFDSMIDEELPTFKYLLENRMITSRNYNRGLDLGIFYLFKFMCYNQFFDSHYKIKLIEYFVDDPIRFFNIHIVDNLVEEWDSFEEIYSPEEFHYAITGPLMGEGKVLHQTCVYEADNVLVDFIGKLEKTLNRTEIANDLNANPLVFICVARNKDEITTKAFWEYLKRNLDKNQQKEFLRHEDENFYTALDASMFNNKTFEVVKKIYEEFFTRQEIQEILLKFKDEKLPIFYDFLTVLTIEDNLKISKYYEDIFDGNKLNKLLSHRDEYGNTIFSFSEFKNEKYEINLKIYEETLRKNFENEKEFEIFYNGLKLQSKLAKGLKIDTWHTGDFYQLVQNWDKNLIKANSSIFYDLGYIESEHEDLIVKFLKKVNETLSTNEIMEMLSQNQNYFFKNVMKTAKTSSIETIKFLTEFLQSLFKYDFKNLLTTTDEFKWTFLQYSAFNIDSNLFNFVKKEYEKFLSPQMIKEIILKLDSRDLTFIYSVIDVDGNYETIVEVSQFLEELLNNDILILRDFLSVKTQTGYTIYSYFKNFYHNQIPQKLKLFTDLLRKTFDNQSDYVSYLRKLNLRNFTVN